MTSLRLKLYKATLVEPKFCGKNSNWIQREVTFELNGDRYIGHFQGIKLIGQEKLGTHGRSTRGADTSPSDRSREVCLNLQACYACGQNGHYKFDCPGVKPNPIKNKRRSADRHACWGCGQPGHRREQCRVNPWP